MSEGEGSEIVTREATPAPVQATPVQAAPAGGGRRMEWTPTTILALAGAIALLMTGAGVGYYFIGFLPMKFAKEQAARAAEEKKREDAAAAAAAAAANSQKSRQQAYQTCLSDAEQRYSANWDRSCQSNADDQDKLRAECLQRGYGWDYCISNYPQLPTTDCKLSTVIANNWNSTLEADKARCLAQYNAGL